MGYICSVRTAEQHHPNASILIVNCQPSAIRRGDEHIQVVPDAVAECGRAVRVGGADDAARADGWVVGPVGHLDNPVKCLGFGLARLAPDRMHVPPTRDPCSIPACAPAAGGFAAAEVPVRSGSSGIRDAAA
jgi:hypothetical protein